jgi:hypothetical protein
MDINKNIILAVSLITASLFFQQCSCTKTLGIECTQVKYSFELPVKAYPDKDTVNIGDTIWLEINESTSFKNNQSGEIVDYSGASNLGSAIAFASYEPILKQWQDGVKYFNFKLLKGAELRTTTLDIEYKFLEENGRYTFKLGVVAKEKGKFRFLLSNSNNTARKNDNCTKANFVINFAQTNQHYYLNPLDTTTTGVSGNYFFYVK